MHSSKNVGLYGKNKTIKLLEDSTADFTTSHLHNSEEHKYFSNMMPKTQTIRGKTTNHKRKDDKPKSIEFENVCSFKEVVQSVEREATE